MSIPVLHTERLLIRRFGLDDLDGAVRLLDDDSDDPVGARNRRTEWLEWMIQGYDQFDRLYQPPYGDRAIALKSNGVLIGAVGLVPSFNAFGQIPSLADGTPPGLNSSEIGLFWCVLPEYQQRGYATEAAQAMIGFAFNELAACRVVATTEYENLASQRVMAKVGMRVERNPLPDPPWLQIVGILENPRILNP